MCNQDLSRTKPKIHKYSELPSYFLSGPQEEQNRILTSLTSHNEHQWTIS